jgi:hypothetical protein
VVGFPSCRPTVSGLKSRHYQISWVVVDLELGPLSLLRLRYRKSSLIASGTCRADHVMPFYPHKLALQLANQQRPIGRYNSLADWSRHWLRESPSLLSLSDQSSSITSFRQVSSHPNRSEPSSKLSLQTYFPSWLSCLSTMTTGYNLAA